MLNWTKILWPTDFSEASQAARPYAKLLADRFQATLHVIHVVPEFPSVYIPFFEDTLTYLRSWEETVNHAKAKLEHVAQGLEGEGYRVVYELLEGVPHQQILEYADRIDADVIVMGTKGLTGLEGLVIGSVTERVVRAAKHPVLSVREPAPERPKIERVLISTDLSEAAAAGVELGVSLAETFGAEIHLLYVVELFSYEPEKVEAFIHPEEFQQVSEKLKEAMGEVSTAATVHKHVIKGLDVASRIAEFAEEIKADLLVMSTHGRTGLARLLLGSVTEKVLKISPVPVLTIRPTKLKD